MKKKSDRSTTSTGTLEPFSPFSPRVKAAPYNKAKHIKELQAALIPTRLYTAQTGEELKEIINAEVECMKANPLTDQGRSLLAYWLDSAPIIAYKQMGPTDAEQYLGMALGGRWETPEYSASILSALNKVLVFHVKHDTGMCKAVKALIAPGGQMVYFNKPDGAPTWWQTKLMRLQDVGYSVGSRFDKVKILDGYRTADYFYMLLHAQDAPVSGFAQGWASDKLTEIKQGESLRYKGKLYSFRGKGRWDIIKLLCETTDPEGWTKLPDNSRSLSKFSGEGESYTFKKAAIQPRINGKGNDAFRICP